MRWFLPILTFSAISVLDFQNLQSPVIYSDDWCFLIYNKINGLIRWFDFTARRPFQSTLYALVMSLTGLHLQPMLWLNLIITTAAGVVFYWLIRRTFPKTTWLALPAALVFLVYPVDYTRTWLAVLVIRVVMLVTLGILYLLNEYRLTGGWWKLILALTGMILSLAVYEGQLGIYMVSAVLFMFARGDLPRQRRLSFLGILVIGILFILLLNGK